MGHELESLVDDELAKLLNEPISLVSRQLNDELEKLLNEHIAIVDRLQGGLDTHMASVRRHYKRFKKGAGGKSDALTHMLSSIDTVQEFLLLIARHIGTMKGILAVQEIKAFKK